VTISVDLIFKIAAVGIIVSILHTVLKQAGKEDFGWAVTLVGTTIILLMVLQLVQELFDTVKAMFNLY